MGDQGPEYTLRRPVDIYQPLPIVFQQDDEESGGYFVQEDGMASKTRPSASDQAVRNLSVSFLVSLCVAFFFFFATVFQFVFISNFEALFDFEFAINPSYLIIILRLVMMYPFLSYH